MERVWQNSLATAHAKNISIRLRLGKLINTKSDSHEIMDLIQLIPASKVPTLSARAQMDAISPSSLSFGQKWANDRSCSNSSSFTLSFKIQRHFGAAVSLRYCFRWHNLHLAHYTQWNAVVNTVHSHRTYALITFFRSRSCNHFERRSTKIESRRNSLFSRRTSSLEQASLHCAVAARNSVRLKRSQRCEKSHSLFLISTSLCSTVNEMVSLFVLFFKEFFIRLEPKAAKNSQKRKLCENHNNKIVSGSSPVGKLNGMGECCHGEKKIKIVMANSRSSRCRQVASDI